MAKTNVNKPTQGGRQPKGRGQSDKDLGAKWGVEGRKSAPQDVHAQSIPGGLDTAQDERGLDQPIVGNDQLNMASLDQPPQGDGDQPMPSLDQTSKGDGDRLDNNRHCPGDEERLLEYKPDHAGSGGLQESNDQDTGEDQEFVRATLRPTVLPGRPLVNR